MRKKTETAARRRYGRAIWALPVLIAVAAALVLFGFAGKSGTPLTAGGTGLVCQAEYPEMIQRPPDREQYIDEDVYFDILGAWNSSIQARRNQAEPYGTELNGFFMDLFAQLLNGGEPENQVCSPIGAYMALAALAEVTGGSSREQILNCLGVENIEELRVQANALWNAFYCDDGDSVSLVETSLMLNQEVRVKQETLELLAANEYVSAYRDETETESISLKTGVEYLGNRSDSLFFTEHVYDGVFYGASGELNCEYLYVEEGQSIYYGEGFQAIEIANRAGYEAGDRMWFILPDESSSVNEVLASEELLYLLQSEGTNKWEAKEYYGVVGLSIPKFVVTATEDIQEALQELGVTEAFDEDSADLSPLLKGRSRQAAGAVEQSVSVVFDENGLYTAETRYPDERGHWGIYSEVDLELTFDRPFIFALAGPEGLPLLVGIVNQP